MKKNPLRKLLIIDNDPILQDFLQDYFVQQNFSVFSLPSGEKIEEFLVTETIDIILLDIPLPERDGYFWLRWLKEHYTDLPVLILSLKNTPDDRVLGLELGAKDYLVKPADPRELLVRINNILSCSRFIKKDSKVVFGNYSFEVERGNLWCGNELIRLTTTESHLLKVLCTQHNITLSRDELTLSLRGSEHNPHDRSIDVHINRLRNKIEDIPSNPKYLLTTWGKGYRFVIET
jgi:DNA-binding response OmpR family regulator